MVITKNTKIVLVYVLLSLIILGCSCSKAMAATYEGITIQRTPVTSSAIRSVGYDSSTRILEIEFTGGSVYRYYEVPSDVYRGLMSAESHGKYFNRYIKNGGYRYTRLP